MPTTTEGAGQRTCLNSVDRPRPCTGGTKCSPNCSRGLKTPFVSFLDICDLFLFFPAEIVKKGVFFFNAIFGRGSYLLLEHHAYPIAPVKRIHISPHFVSLVEQDRFKSWPFFTFRIFLAPPAWKGNSRLYKTSSSCTCMESLTATPPLPLLRQQQGMGVWRVGEMEAHMWASGGHFGTV